MTPQPLPQSQPHPPPRPLPLPTLSPDEAAALNDLYRRGTPANTLRAWERDLTYIVAWKAATFGAAPAWPESEQVALRFVLDHAVDLTDRPDLPARAVALLLIGQGLRRSLGCPAVSTLDRRIASWRAFHRMKNLPSPFEAPLLRQARGRARRAAATLPVPKSRNPITRDVLLALIAAAGSDLRGLRDRAILMLGWASGGRRRSEIVGLDAGDLDATAFAARGLLWLRLVSTKTTARGKTPRLVLKGPAARAVMAWTAAAGITGGPLFRRIDRNGRLGAGRLSGDAVALILRRLVAAAGFPAGFVSPHGLRSGFLTQAARDGAPIQAAMRLSLHKSLAQAQRYYDDVEVADNPAADLLRDDQG